MPADQVILPIPTVWSRKNREKFLLHARTLAGSGNVDAVQFGDDLSRVNSGFAAAVHIVSDLVDQGWTIEIGGDRSVAATPPDVEDDPQTEKDRVRRQE